MFRVVSNCAKCQLPVVIRRWSSGASENVTAGEQKILSVLKTKFPNASETQVQDISGGCGSMFEIYIESADFNGKRLVMQHKMVTDALKDEIKDMHGLTIKTSTPT